jgi:hypothetical protein
MTFVSVCFVNTGLRWRHELRTQVPLTWFEGTKPNKSHALFAFILFGWLVRPAFQKLSEEAEKRENEQDCKLTSVPRFTYVALMELLMEIVKIILEIHLTVKTL